MCSLLSTASSGPSSQWRHAAARVGACGSLRARTPRQRRRATLPGERGIAKLASAMTTAHVDGGQPIAEEQQHLSPDERAELGKAARAETPRSSHAEWTPNGDRPDPIDLLEQQAATRVPELVPIRYGRMAASPFAFFRGAAYVMASDLAATPTSGFRAQLCGDAHLSNFGGFASPERDLLFDVNDFDETLPGPWEWDVKRLVASLSVAGRDRGFSTKQRRAVVVGGVSKYREAMQKLSELGDLGIWYEHIDESVIA